ncbi:amidase [Vibrio sp.]|nr:amidase [Vibrio viridaestus]MDC0609783.1 amidase [Vibrio sp.]
MWKLSATELLAGYKSGEISPVDVIKSVLQRSKELNPILNALYDIQEEKAIAEAIESEARWKAGQPKGPLDGVPAVVKDSIDVAGMRMFRGVKARYDIEPSTEDSPPAARLIEAGAIIFAKTTMPDMGFLGAGVSSFHGVTRNPWDTSLNTGGSSAGAGAAIASGMAPLAIGSDVGGSVRLPASHCGIVGLKPTAGVVPHLPYSRDRVVGPLTRTVEDAILLMSVIDGPDSRAFEKGANIPSQLDKLDLTGKKIGVLTDMGCGEKAQPEVEALVRKAASVFEELGAEVSDIKAPLDFSFLEDMRVYFSVKAGMERASLPQGRTRDVLDVVNAQCDSVEGIPATQYVMAASRFDKAQRLAAQMVDKYDFVLAPTMPMPNFGAEMAGANEDRPQDHVVFTALFNQTGQPAAVMPCGFVGTSPVGLQIISSLNKDTEILQACLSYAEATSYHYTFPTVA